MIRRHLASRRPELSRRDVAEILAARLGRVGRSSYGDGDFWPGLALVIRAVWYGDPALRNLVFLLGAAPPARWLKRMLRGAAKP
jgi:hypothetical protein